MTNSVMATTTTREFPDPASAIANAKKLLANKQIKQADYDKIEHKMISKMSMQEFAKWRKAGNKESNRG